MVKSALAAALLVLTAADEPDEPIQDEPVQEEPAPYPPARGKSRKARERAPLPAPTVAELGVPIYPGSRYDAQISGGMSGEDQKIWVYFSDDAPRKVLAFYEQKTGKKGVEADRDKFMISLKGKSIVPEHGVTVETLAGNPLFGNKGKTVITVLRRTGD
jgi:hypothetical protein